MPTFTAIALDRLIEPGASRSATKSVQNSNLERRNSTSTLPPQKSVYDSKSVQNSNLERRNSTSTLPTAAATEQKYHWAQISPALYATPEATPIPGSPSSFPPSPYIINHKRRGPRLLKSFSEDDVASRKQDIDEGKVNGNVTDAKTVVDNLTNDAAVRVNDVTVPEFIEAEHVSGFHAEEVGSSEVGNGIAKENVSVRCISLNSERDGEPKDFYDPQESNGFHAEEVGSSEVGNGMAKENVSVRRISLNSERDGEPKDFYDPQESMSYTNNTEFYDATEELSYEGTPPPYSLRDAEAEVREIRLSLLMEIEKRKQADEALIKVRSQWQRIREQLSLAGLILPADPTGLEEDEQQDFDPVEDLCQQVYLTRYVADSIGRGMAKAEVEMEMESQIEAKNFEIARLCDRLHYYEAVNREMSQRNQEAVELSRRERQRRKKRQRWVWGSIATAITLGTAALAWSYLPSEKGSSSTDLSQDSEHHDASK